MTHDLFGNAVEVRRGTARLTDIAVVLHRETDRAVLVSDGIGDAVWLPKSQVGIDRTNERFERGRHVVTITLPEWLAKEKGLI